ncbi:hypothetical protein JW859_05220 [bacterium]|nr:hypothetical protein [bacterium]
MERNKLSAFILLAFILLIIGGCGGATQEVTDIAGGDGPIAKPEPIDKGASDLGSSGSVCDLLAGETNYGTCEIFNDGNVLHFIFTASDAGFDGVRVYADTVPPAEGDDGEGIEPSASLVLEPTTQINSSLSFSDGPVGMLTEVTPTVVPQVLDLGPLMALPYSRDFDAPRDSLSLEFMIAGWDYAEMLYITAAVTVDGETATARDPGDPATELLEYWPLPVLNLPPEPQSTYIAVDSDSTYLTTLMHCPTGYDVQSAMPYTGWCVDLYHHISPNQIYDAMLYNSYDPNLPERLKDSDWDLANYVINHRIGNRWSVQAALWYFVGGGNYPSNDENAVTMVEDALENGEGYTPSFGDRVLVLVDVDEDTQVTAVELDVWYNE